MKSVILMIFAALTALPSSPSALAADQPQSIAVTSFHSSGGRNAEICGVITGVQAPLYGARIETDYKSSNPAPYTVLADAKGDFCATVVTYTGQARADVWVPGTKSIPAKPGVVVSLSE